jgi:hypothetical protein
VNRPIAPEVVEAELARLPDMSLDELKARWLELKGVPLPKFMRRGLITRAVAHAIEERATGGLDRETRKRLEQLMRQIVPSGERPPPAPKRIKVGTRLLREWQGRVHEVTVAADGFTWNGVRHRSLSDIARRITGARWNGWVFFGLKTTRAPDLPVRARSGRKRRTPADLEPPRKSDGTAFGSRHPAWRRARSAPDTSMGSSAGSSPPCVRKNGRTT